MQLLRIDPNSGVLRFTFTKDRDVFESEVGAGSTCMHLHEVSYSKGHPACCGDGRLAAAAAAAATTLHADTVWCPALAARTQQAKALEYLKNEGPIQVQLNSRDLEQ